MNSGETPNSGAGKRSKSLVPPSFSITRAGAESQNRALEALNEYVGGREEAQPIASVRPKSTQLAPDELSGNGSSASKEKLVQEWEIAESVDEGELYEDDILQRLDRMEKRLDAFENTCYTFLLYTKQLADRTVSFYEDIFGLSREDLAQIHDRLGINYNNKGDYPKAIDAFKKLVELHRTPVSCFKLGVAYDNNGDFQEAVEAYRSAIALDTGYLRAYYKLAEVYARTENYGEAIRCLTQAAEADPNNPETHYRLGGVHSARGSYDQAIAAFNRVLKLDPGYPGIYQSLGLAYEQKGEHDRAIQFFKKSI